MQTTTYTYNGSTYTSLYALSEALGKDGIFIPLSISDEDLTALGVTITYEEEALDVIRQRKIVQLKAHRDSAEVTPIEYNGNSFDYDDKARDRMPLLSLWTCRARAQALTGRQQTTRTLKLPLQTCAW